MQDRLLDGEGHKRPSPPHQDQRAIARSPWARPIIVGAGLFVFSPSPGSPVVVTSGGDTLAATQSWDIFVAENGDFVGEHVRL
jgi:hypothetical protein